MTQLLQALASGSARLGIGDATDLALAISHFCPEVQTMTFIGYQPRPVLEERLEAFPNQVVREIYRRARSARRLAQADIPVVRQNVIRANNDASPSRECLNEHREIERRMLY